MTAAPAFYEIPLKPTPATFGLVLSGVQYQLALTYRNIDQGGWLLDLRSSNGDPVVCGMPLVTGHDLLEQHHHVGIPGALLVVGDAMPDDVPTFADIGTVVRLYYVLPV